MPILNLVHVNLHVADLERSIDFYGRMGWKVMHELGRHEPMDLERVPLGDALEHGGGRAKGVVLSLGDDPRASTKLEIMEYVDPPASAKPFKPRQEAGVHRVAMRVKDIHATIAEFRAKGIPIEDTPHEIKVMGGRQLFVLFADPDDNLLELIELFAE